MKNIKIIFYLSIVALFSACSSDHASVNNDTNLIQSNILFNEYKKNVIEYSEKSNFPDIKK